MVFYENFKEDVFLRFLKKSIRQANRKMFLIVDNHRAHKSKKVIKWLTENVEHIKLFYLPSYCPELNPDEFLNQDVKSHLGKKRLHNKTQTAKELNSHLKMRQKQPDVIKNFVKWVPHPEKRYSQCYEFGEALVLAIPRVIANIMRDIPHAFSMQPNNIFRKDIPLIPDVLIREAVCNAVMQIILGKTIFYPTFRGFKQKILNYLNNSVLCTGYEISSFLKNLNNFLFFCEHI